MPFLETFACRHYTPPTYVTSCPNDDGSSIVLVAVDEGSFLRSGRGFSPCKFLKNEHLAREISRRAENGARVRRTPWRYEKSEKGKNGEREREREREREEGKRTRGNRFSQATRFLSLSFTCCSRPDPFWLAALLILLCLGA